MAWKTNESVGRCAKCLWKIWKTDKIVRREGKIWHARCAPEPEKVKITDDPKPQMKGTGGWGGYRMYPTNQPTKDKKDDKSKGFTGGWKQWANHPRPDP